MGKRDVFLIEAKYHLLNIKVCLVYALVFSLVGCWGTGNQQYWRCDLNTSFEGSKQDGLPILLVFSAYGLGDHEFLDELAFSKKIHRVLRRNFEVTVLMVDDERTTDLQSEKDCLSNIFNDFQSTSGLVNLGALYRHFEADVFHQNFQPLYVIVDSHGKVLQGPMGYQNHDADKFLDFLEQGLEEHKNIHKAPQKLR